MMSNRIMVKPKHQYPVKIATTALILVALVLIFFLSSDDQTPQEPLDRNAKNTISKESSDISTPEKTDTIATLWRWQSTNNPTTAEQPIAADINSETSVSSPTLPFTQKSVYQALHSVKLDENDDLILDDDALNALNKTFEGLDIELDDLALAELQEMIKMGLPGNAGEQTARVVADYYRYLMAAKEFNSIYESPGSSAENMEDQRAKYNELSALRELYLGAEVADKLFATSDANARYMFDSMQVEADTTLSDQEKKQQQAEIIERHQQQTISIRNWNERYRDFLADKQNVLDATLSDSQKRDQIDALMRQHFSNDELEMVSHLPLGSL